MRFLDLEKIKKHLNIDNDFVDDDEYIKSLGEVAESIVEKHIDDKLENIAEENGGVLPSPILHACLLFIGNMYMNRESVTFASASELPLSYEYLLSPFKNYNQSKI